MSLPDRLLLILLVLALHLYCPVPGMTGGIPGSDSAVLSRLFAEQHIEDIALDLRREGLRLTPEQRYAFLRKWLLPSETHETWRLPYAFTPADPSPLVRVSLGIPSAGGELVSPVYDLIDIAHQLGRLNQLEDEILRLEPGNNQHDVKTKLSYLILIAMEKQDESLTNQRLWQFLQLALADADTEAVPSPAEWLVFTKCAESDTLRSQTAECIFKYLDWPQEGDRTPAQRHWTRLDALSRPVISEDRSVTISTITDRPAEVQWHPVTNSSARTNGRGCPNSIWKVQPAIVENIVSHHDDYLYFAIPLRGEYAVECDVTGDDWLDSQLSIAGRWVAPTNQRDALITGSFRQKFPPVKLPSPLTSWKGWSHYRAVITQDSARHFLNGRQVYEEPLSPDSNPWIAIRSSFWRTGAVRNLTITGNPLVPDEINMLADRGLNDWAGYFGESVGSDNSHWTLHEDELQAKKDTSDETTGSHTESLLRYHRPLLEDGTIHFEFFYDPGNSEVHPAIGRMVLRLDPAGVKLHWLTDGLYDRTGIAPDNILDVSTNRRTEGPLPLRTGGWNLLTLTLEDDFLWVVLNGTLIFEHQLEPESSRTFGLFHYSDRSAVRVRNLVYKGDWPQQLPGVSDQLLASDAALRIDSNIDHMSDVFVHRFKINNEWRAKFMLAPGTSRQNITATESGLQTSREAKTAFQDVTLVANLKIHGDFDVIAKYTDFSAIPAPGGHGSANLLVRQENETSDKFSSCGNTPSTNPENIYTSVPARLSANSSRARSTSSLDQRLWKRQPGNCACRAVGINCTT